MSFNEKTNKATEKALDEIKDKIEALNEDILAAKIKKAELEDALIDQEEARRDFESFDFWDYEPVSIKRGDVAKYAYIELIELYHECKDVLMYMNLDEDGEDYINMIGTASKILERLVLLEGLVPNGFYDNNQCCDCDDCDDFDDLDGFELKEDDFECDGDCMNCPMSDCEFEDSEDEFEDGCDDSSAFVKMTVIDKNGNKRVRMTRID